MKSSEHAFKVEIDIGPMVFMEAPDSTQWSFSAFLIILIMLIYRKVDL
jgi:hypothetical protein